MRAKASTARRPLRCATLPRRTRRFAVPLSQAHDAEHLVKFEELVEAAVDLDRVPDEYLIAPSYDPRLEVRRDSLVLLCCLSTPSRPRTTRASRCGGRLSCVGGSGRRGGAAAPFGVAAHTLPSALGAALLVAFAALGAPLAPHAANAPRLRFVWPPAPRRPQKLRDAKVAAEQAIERLAGQAASDLGLELHKQLKLEWHKAANQRTRCLRITQKEEKAVRSKLQAR